MRTYLSYMETQGFSAVNADELFSVSGGSSNTVIIFHGDNNQVNINYSNPSGGNKKNNIGVLSNPDFGKAL